MMEEWMDVLPPPCQAGWWFLLYRRAGGAWSPEENKLFEEALALVDGDTPDRWELVASLLPRKTVADVMAHYDDLENDVMPHLFPRGSRTAAPTSTPSTSPSTSRFSMVDPHELEGLEGSEPDYHPKELEGHEGEMEMFIVPPNPPRTGQGQQKRARGKKPASRGMKSASSGGSGSGQPAAQQQHTAAAQQQTTAAAQQQITGSSQQQTTGSSSSSRLKSKVWKDFTKISNDGDELIIAKCNHCSAELSGKSQNGTSHLRRHTEAKHKTDQSTMNNFFLKSETNDDGTIALKNVRYDAQVARHGISIYLVSGSHPFTTVEEDGFRTMMSACCPAFKSVGRHTIKREIMAMFLAQKKELLEVIVAAPGRVSFTSDNWKSEVTKHSYICITCHYIDADWKLNKRIVWFKKIDPPYDGATIADEVHLAFREWRIDKKVMCITLDNASYNDRMIVCLRTHLSKGALPLSGKFFQIRCYAHILNLVVQAGLTLIDDGVGKLRDGIMYLKASGNRLHKFHSTARTIFNLEESRKLKPDMPIRWNSTYTMLGCCLYFREVFDWYSERDSVFKDNFLLSEEQWAKVSHMYQFLEVFFKVTTVFSGTKYPTANLYFMNVYLVHTAILEANDGINSYMGPMLAVMREKFMKYWSDYSVFLSCAAVLDPRIKFKFLAYSYSKLYDEDDALRRINNVRSTMTSLFNEYGSGLPVHENLAAGSSSTSGLGAFSDYDQYVQSTSSQEEKSELELYLAEPVKKLNDNIDILDYWSKSAARYPQLARLARDILAVPVSSVASESAFSLSKKVITPNRASLKPKTVEALMCLQDWYRVKLQKQEGNKRKAEVVELDNDGDSSSDEECNKRKAEVVELDNDGDSSSDEECNIPFLYSSEHFGGVLGDSKPPPLGGGGGGGRSRLL